MHSFLLKYFKLYIPPTFPSSHHPPLVPPNFPGNFKARGPTSGHVVVSGAVAGGVHCSPFGSTLASPFGLGAANLSSATPLFSVPSHTSIGAHCGLNMPQIDAPCSGHGMTLSVSVEGCPEGGLNMNPSCGGVGLLLSGSLVGNPMVDPLLAQTGMGHSVFGGNLQAGAVHLGGFTPQGGGGVPMQPHTLSGSMLGETMNKNNNQFLS